VGARIISLSRTYPRLVMSSMLEELSIATGDVPIEPSDQPAQMNQKSKSAKFTKAKHRLEQRPPPLRGADARTVVHKKHADADHRGNLQRQARRSIAARHNNSVNKVVAESRDAQAASVIQRSHGQRGREEAAAARHTATVEKVRAKGTKEVDKVASAVAAQQDAVVRTRHAMNDAMSAAVGRHAAEVHRVSLKGATEVQKVSRVTGRPLLGKKAMKERAASTERDTDPKDDADASLLQPHSPDSVLVKDYEASDPAKFDRREAGLVLTLMRYGVPNAEVLCARTSTELEAVAAKYLMQC